MVGGLHKQPMARIVCIVCGHVYFVKDFHCWLVEFMLI